MARYLHIDQSTVVRKLHKYGLTLNHFVKVPVGGGNETDVNGLGSDAAHAGDLLHLQHPQKLDLESPNTPLQISDVPWIIRQCGGGDAAEGPGASAPESVTDLNLAVRQLEIRLLEQARNA